MDSGKFKWGKLLGGAGAIAALVLGGLLIKSLISDSKTDSKKPPKIVLMPTTPPPPPPPPKEEKKPEPPKEDKEVKMEQPVEQKVEAPPADPTLKMEGEAGDGPSMFGAGKVTNEDLSKSFGTGGGGSGGAYANRLQRHLQDALNRNRKLRESDYRVTLRIWLSPDGSIQRAELARTTGNVTLDDLLTKTLMDAGSLSEAPPENLPQPIRIRVTARGAA